METHTARYLAEAASIIGRIDQGRIEAMVDLLAEVRDRGGRLFVIGSGGGAGHASHAVADFRKVTGIEAYAPTDNVSELTARINDEGWDTSLSAWLKGSRLGGRDLVMVFSVGGGDAERRVSTNLVNAIDHARSVGAKVIGVVGRDGGHTARNADACVVIPAIEARHVTAHTESFQALIWHLLVMHPRLYATEMKWESIG